MRRYHSSLKSLRPVCASDLPDRRVGQSFGERTGSCVAFRNSHKGANLLRAALLVTSGGLSLGQEERMINRGLHIIPFSVNAPRHRVHDFACAKLAGIGKGFGRSRRDPGRLVASRLSIPLATDENV